MMNRRLSTLPLGHISDDMSPVCHSLTFRSREMSLLSVGDLVAISVVQRPILVSVKPLQRVEA